MTRPRCVLDTNVLVSRLLMAGSVPGQAVRRAVDSGVVLVSEATLDELVEVLAADWLVAAADQNVASPGDSISTLVELHALRLLLDLFELPRDEFDGALTTGATASNLLALATARQWCGKQAGVDIARQGWAAAPAIRVLSATPHASAIKCLGIVGFGKEQIVRVATLPEREAMDTAALAEALQEAERDRVQKIVIASAGTVNTTDYDDLTAVADLCRRYKAWLHVDGAFGLFARCSPRYRCYAAGAEFADSITADGHKWLNVPYDCGMFFTRHVEHLEAAVGISAAYLQTGSDLPDFLSRGVESSRRFRALPVWMSLYAYGRQGFRELVEHDCTLAAKLAAWVEQSERFELLAPTRLNVVIFRARFDGTSEQQNNYNRRLLARINASGVAVLTPGVLDGRVGFRAAFSNWRTAAADVDKIAALLNELTA